MQTLPEVSGNYLMEREKRIMQNFMEEMKEYHYDHEMYCITLESGGPALVARKDFKGKFVVPNGLQNLSRIFLGYEFVSSEQLSEFDTSDVTIMNYMFEGCTFPDRFSLGDKFDTSKCTSMAAMFMSCKFQGSFSLGDNFNTENVWDMSGMFLGCKLPKDFTLGDKFDTGRVDSMMEMFEDCSFVGDTFTLGSKFVTAYTRDFSWMFKGCILPKNFELKVPFKYMNARCLEDVFLDCVFPDGTTVKNNNEIEGFHKLNEYVKIEGR